MSAAQRDAFLAEPRIAKLAYLLRDGSPTVVPVWFEWTGSEALVFTSGGSTKVASLRQDPRAALSVETGVGEKEAWVTIEGVVSVEPGGYDLAARLAPRYYPPARASEALASWSRVAADWVLLRLQPSRVKSLAP